MAFSLGLEMLRYAESIQNLRVPHTGTTNNVISILQAPAPGLLVPPYN
jgi:hypothetical protein